MAPQILEMWDRWSNIVIHCLGILTSGCQLNPCELIRSRCMLRIFHGIWIKERVRNRMIFWTQIGYTNLINTEEGLNQTLSCAMYSITEVANGENRSHNCLKCNLTEFDAWRCIGDAKAVYQSRYELFSRQRWNCSLGNLQLIQESRSHSLNELAIF